MELIWDAEAAEHLLRSRRQKNDIDLLPEWAQEVLHDSRVIMMEPDPRSKSGLGIAFIGYSPSAGRVLRVMCLRVGEATFRLTTAHVAPRDDRDAYFEE